LLFLGLRPNLSAVMKSKDIKVMIEEMKKGRRLPLARLISKVENRSADLPEVMKHLYSFTGTGEVWGITGPPGAGKSTLVDCLIKSLRSQGKRVAVIAVDPSSPFSGGAILGDRIRMQEHSRDSGVYIRSLGTRGKHGGLSHATKEVTMVLDAAGFDVILVETAGVGQTELEILRLAQTVAVVLVPESGDGIQVMKAGIMEIADVFVVNKSDRPGADKMVRELLTMVGLGHTDVPTDAHRAEHGKPWRPLVLRTEAVRHKGMEEFVAAMQSHQKYLSDSGKKKEKTKDFLKNELLDILSEKVGTLASQILDTPDGQRLLFDLIERKSDPYESSRKLIQELMKQKEILS
jgi:LAO/AO transport system kinase